MKSLEEKILKEGTVLDGEILKVGSFLNQQLDIDFLMDMGREIQRLFEGSGVTKILTVEASGIAIATCVGAVMHLPVVFAKKHSSGNVSGEVYSSRVHSYTHGNDYDMIVAADYLNENDTVIIVDDFLANGKALEGLIDIANQSGAKVAGCSCAIEKGFQKGGDSLREKGYRIESLAIIDEMDSSHITFRCN